MRKAALGRFKLRCRVLCRHQCLPQFTRFEILPAVPPEMFASHSHPCVFAVELVQGFEVLKNDLCLRSAQEWRYEIPAGEVCIDITKDPWCALRCAADHYSFCTGEIKYCARTRSRIYISVRNQWQLDLRAAQPQRIVLRCAAKHVAAP